jgi:glycosyltransferase involved in cell wall biosynthesis
MGCERWQIGCGRCPDLSIYPALKRDGTALNWLRKRTIYQDSRLYIATPSQWLFSNLEKSMINISEKKVIPNGVDISVFRPALSRDIRIELGLSLDSFILVFVANVGKDNPFKDYSTIERALLSLDAKGVTRKVELIILGGRRTGEDQIGNLRIHYVGFQREASVVAKYYQASDVYLHAARSENFPITILEAFACGTPVIGTSVGGIREQIDDGETGYLIPAGDYQAMASRIHQLLLDDELRTKMGKRCREVVAAEYDLEKQAKKYLEWYEEILSDWTV